MGTLRSPLLAEGFLAGKEIKLGLGGQGEGLGSSPEKC